MNEESPALLLIVRLYTVSTVKRVLEIKDRQKEQQGPGTNISQEFTERVSEANSHWVGRVSRGTFEVSTLATLSVTSHK